MWMYVARRIAAVIPVLMIVALIVFLMLRLTPGDPAAVIGGDSATDADIAQIRENLGLDQPIVSQFFIWVGRMFTGDFGDSFFYKRPVSQLIADRIEPTLALAISTITLATLLAVPMGTLAAYRQGGWVDRVVMAFSVLSFSVPVFVTGYSLIWLLSVKIGWFPVQGYQSIGDGIGGFIHRLILPTVSLATIYVALIARMTRTSVLEVLNEDYVRTARAKGLPELKVVLGHALRNAAVPIVTVIGVGIALLIGGVVVTETVFNIPGLGRLTVDAVLARDYPTVQAVIMLFSVAYVLINLGIDLLYTVLDPRIRY